MNHEEREGQGSDVSRFERLLVQLRRFYGVLPAPPHDAFIVFVWEVLSVGTTPSKRDAALGALRRVRALTPDAVARAPQKTLEQSVALAGPYLEQRLHALRVGADVFRRSPQLAQALRGSPLTARRAARALPLAGPAAAERMLLLAAGHPVLPVDAAIARVGLRLGYGAGSREPRDTARSVRRALSRELDRRTDAYRRALVYLSHHAASTCTEGDPHCGVCPLLEDCPDGRKRTIR